MATEHTYTGPAIENEDRPNSSTPGGVYIAIGVAIVALVIAFVGVWIGSSAESQAKSVDGRVTKLQTESDAAWKVQTKWNKETEADLALAATRTDLLDVAVGKLQTKAEQKLVDQIMLEMKDKSSVARVQQLASDLLLKADKKSVDRIVRRVRNMDKRVENIVSLNKLIEVAPVAPPAAPPEVRRQATLPASQAIPAEQARIDAQRAVPASRPEAPAIKLPPAK